VHNKIGRGLIYVEDCRHSIGNRVIALALELIGRPYRTARIVYTGERITYATINLVGADGIREIIAGAELVCTVVAHPCTASTWSYLESDAAVLCCC